MKKIKVLEIVDSIQYGGVEQFIYNIISKIEKEKYTFEIIMMGKRYPEAEKRFCELGVKIYNIPTKKQNIFKHLADMKHIIKNGDYDVVHSNINFWSFIPLYFAKKYKIKLKIAHIHGTIKENFMIKIYSWLTVKLADIKLACSYEAGKSVYKNQKFEVIANGIDVAKFKFNDKKRELIRKELGISQYDFVIGHIGRFYPVKNHKFIIDLYNNFYNDHKESKLILIGEGELYDECKAKVREYNLESNVIFLGTQNEIQNYYNVFDVFILPSISEGFGMVVLEAQCNGLECMVSKGVPEEVNVCNCVKRLSTDSVQEWINELNNLYKINNRKESNYKIVEKTEYNLNKSCMRIQELYNIRK